MINDALTVFSGGMSAAGVLSYQTVTGTGNVLATNAIDLGVQREIGQGEGINLLAQVGAAQVGPTSVEIQVITADDSGLSSNVTVVGSSGAIPAASLIAGARFPIAVNPRIGVKGQRYMGVRYLITGTSTGGSFFVAMGGFGDSAKFYPSGYSMA